MARGLRRYSARPKNRADLGPAFGPELTAAEVRYLMTEGMGALPGRHFVAALQARADHAAEDRDALAAFMATAETT